MSKHMFKPITLGVAVVTLVLLTFFQLPIAHASVIWTQNSNPSGGEDVAWSAAVGNDGAYMVGYYNVAGSDYAWRIEKRNLSDGSIIWTQNSNPSAYSDKAMSVAVGSDGVYVVGYFNWGVPSPGSPQWRMEKRSLSNGSLIWSQNSDPTSEDDEALGVAVDSTGVYVVGFDNSQYNTGGTVPRMRIEKRNLNNGSLIWSQDSSPNPTRYSRATGVAVDTNGVYMVGYYSVASQDSAWRIEKRNLSSGSIIWAQNINSTPVLDEAYGIAVGSDGVYVAGSDNSWGGTNFEWHMEKRNLIDGSYMWAQSINPSNGNDRPRSIVVDSTGVYVVGWDLFPGYPEWRMEKRNLLDGGLIWTDISNPCSYAIADGVAQDNTGIYVAGYDNCPGNSEWRVEKRTK